MEALGVLIAICVIVWLIYLLVAYIIAPIAGILGIITLSCGIIYAFKISTSSFWGSLVLHKNPYTTYVDTHKGAVAGVRRNYFFGPGYHQIKITIHDAFKNQNEHIEKIKSWRKKFRERHTGQWYINIWGDLFYWAAFICAFVLGSIWTAAFSIILFSVISIGMLGFYVFFSLLWLIDRITLTIRSIHSRCPSCKRISVVPVFICPECGTQHPNLTPGPYGVFLTKCVCGFNLPTTVFNGRSQLEAVCPHCHALLAASNAKQFGIQLVGGVSSGKTTFLTAYWHLYLDKIRNNPNIEIELFPKDAFDDLERWFQSGLSYATSEMNANMYSVIIRRADDVPYQLTIYDVAGESFSDMSSDVQQQQIGYCEGIVIVIDPLSPVEASSICISGFVDEYKKLRGIHSSKLSDIPVAIIISKSDLFKKEIGLPKIKSIHNSAHNSENNSAKGDITKTRDEVCRNFLLEHGYSSVLNIIDSEFINYHFFSTSAMGHEASSGDPYVPWGVLEPVEWIFSSCNVNFL